MRKKSLSLFLAVVLLITAVCPAAYAEDVTYDEEISALAVEGNPTRGGEAGINLIKSFESCRLTAYKAVSTERYWTIGWGHYGPDVTEGMTITQEQADAMFDEDIVEYETYLNTFLNKNNISVNQSQYDALLSFTYNTGNVWVSYTKPDFRLRNYLIAGIENYTEEEVRAAFVAWSNAGGVQLAGLVRRRNAECDLFFSELNRPTDPWVKVDKTIASVGEKVNFTFGAENATNYAVIVTRANEAAEEILVVDVTTGSYTAEFTKSGIFTAFVMCSNSDGHVNSEEITFTVYGDLGDEFTTPILHKAQDKYLEMDADGIYTASENGKADQQWYFERQSDGTYVISSCYDGSYLTVSNGEVVLGSDAHKWYIWEESRGYVLMSKSTDKVLGLDESVTTETYDGLETQIWEFDIDEDAIPQKPQVNVVLGNDEFETIISWNEGYGAKGHNLKIWRNRVSDSEPYLVIEDAEAPIEELLPMGTYQGYVEAYHEYGTQQSETFTFTVTDNPIVKYDANGGTGAPNQQQKAEGARLTLSSSVPTRVGHAFNEWNTAADGSGRSYAPGATFTSDENTVLYAIWTGTSQLPGDVNSDEKVSNADLILVARMIVGQVTKESLSKWENGDLNDDKEITNADLVRLARMIVAI